MVNLLMKNNSNREMLLFELAQAALSPSILAASPLNFYAELQSIEKYCSCFHVDVMDGHYVPNLTFGPELIKSLAENFAHIIDVHLMITNPEKTWRMYRDAGAHVITFHPETTLHPDRLIKEIQDSGAIAGVAINPGTSLDLVAEFIGVADLFLVMSVNPGFGGQKFIDTSLHKITRLKNLIATKNAVAIIEVDGGVNEKNAPEIYASGAHLLVAGSAIFAAKDRVEALKNLRSK